jgi:peptidoglycan-associated lipoprotein
MARKLLAFLCLAAIAGPVSAQRQPAPPPLTGIDLSRAEFAAQSGGSTVYFPLGSDQLTTQARTVLVAQARWIRQHPDIVVRIEGHADGGDTRDHALAVGARRAQDVRDYLVMLGVPSAQVTAMSWGKERPGPGRVTTILVR